jgi:hypothetical protein
MLFPINLVKLEILNSKLFDSKEASFLFFLARRDGGKYVAHGHTGSKSKNTIALHCMYVKETKRSPQKV